MQQQDEFLDLLKSLIREPSVTGAEHSFFRVLQRELEERGAMVYWYQGLLVACFRVQVRQDFPDDHRVFDTGNDLHRSFTLLAFEDIDAETRLSRLAQVIDAWRSMGVRSSASVVCFAALLILYPVWRG